MGVIIIKEKVECALVVGRIRSDEFPKQDMNTENQVFKISVYLIIPSPLILRKTNITKRASTCSLLNIPLFQQQKLFFTRRCKHS